MTAMNGTGEQPQRTRPTLASLSRYIPALHDSSKGRWTVTPETVVARIPERYFASVSEETAARHVELLASLSRSEPYALDVAQRAGGLSVTVITVDSPGLLSLLAGILGSAGYDIKSGELFTMEKAERPEPAPDHRAAGIHRGRNRSSAIRNAVDRLPVRRVVDQFTGVLVEGMAIDRFVSDVVSLLDRVVPLLLDASKQGAARRLVDEAVASALRGGISPEQNALLPLEVGFIQEQEGDKTVMEVRGEDTPFFLYSLGAGLSLQRVGIESVSISTLKHTIQDRFELALPANRGTPEHLSRLRFLVLLTKQFTYFLGSAPDPYAALERFESLCADLLSRADSDLEEMVTQPFVLRELARLLGASDYLWEDFIRLQYESLIPLLSRKQGLASTEPAQVESLLQEQLDQVTSADKKQKCLNEFKDAENFRIDVDHILQPDLDFFFLSSRLTALAEAIVRAALQIAWDDATALYGTPRTVAGLAARWAAFGLGKLGGRALGYASDLELLFVYSDSGTTDGEQPIRNAEFFERFFMAAVRSIKTKREGIFAIDLRLRPYGSDGPNAVSLESFNRYYGRDGDAHSYERLALTRLRAVAGDAELAETVEQLRDELLYAADSVDLAELRELRLRQFREKSKGDLMNAKFSPGGLVDLEYSMQILLVTHGRTDPTLRTPSIHEALDAFAVAGVLDSAEAKRLRRSYQFLRRLINGLRMLRGNARDLFLPPVESLEYAHLARRTGYIDSEQLSAAQQLQIEFDSRTAAVRAFVERHLGRETLPGDAPGNAADLVLTEGLDEARAEQICRRAGITNALRAQRNVTEIAGRGAARERFSELVVLAWNLLQTNIDPDLALNNWARYVAEIDNREEHFLTLLRHPRLLELMLQVFATSQFLANVLIRDPGLIEWALDSDRVNRERNQSEMQAELEPMLVGADTARRREVLRWFRRREILRIGTRDICLGVSLEAITREISALARASLNTALRAAFDTHRVNEKDQRRFTLLAFGKLGGNELNYSSDIDLLGVYQPDTSGSRGEDQNRYESVLKDLRADLAEHTEHGYAYRVDFRLRPFGSAGPLAATTDAVIRYYERDAAAWELQASLKLAWVSGSVSLAEDLMAQIAQRCASRTDSQEVRETIRRLRSEAKRIAAKRGHDIKNGPGGIRDIEFVVQGLQLTVLAGKAVLHQPNTLAALRALGEKGYLTRAEMEIMIEDYVFLRRVEHTLQLFDDQQIHTLPTDSAAGRIGSRLYGRPVEASVFLKDVETVERRTRERYERFLDGDAI